MQSKATTAEKYLAELPEDRRLAISAVRQVILKNIDPTYEEGMCYGMISYYVPHSVFPAGYHCDPSKPLVFTSLASQKQYMSLYMMSLYGDCGDGESPETRWLRDAFEKSGKKLDMGKCCIRFKKLEDLPLDVVGEAIRRMPAKLYVERYEQALASRGRGTKSPEARGQKATKKNSKAVGKKRSHANAGAKKKTKKRGT